MKTIRFPINLENDIEFVRKEFGEGSVSYRTIQRLLNELAKSKQENERITKKLDGKERYIEKLENLVERLKK